MGVSSTSDEGIVVAKRINQEDLDYLETVGLDPSQVAADLGVMVGSIAQYYRRLGDPRRIKYGQRARELGEQG